MGKGDFPRFQGTWWLPSGSGTWTGGARVGQAEAFWPPRTLGFGFCASLGPWRLNSRFTDGTPPLRLQGLTAPRGPNLPSLSLGVPPSPPVPFPSIPSVGSSLDHGSPPHEGRLRSLGNTRGSLGGKTEAFRGWLKGSCDFYPSASSPWSPGDNGRPEAGRGIHTDLEIWSFLRRRLAWSLSPVTLGLILKKKKIM